MADDFYTLVFTHQLQLPVAVPGLQDYLLAFFRGSAHGPWWPDDEAAPNGRGILRFYRGNWLLSERTGERWPLPPLDGDDRAAVERMRPAQLAIAVRQADSHSMAIAVQYRYLYPVQEAAPLKQRDREKAHWTAATQQEIEALQRYLQESLGLTERQKAQGKRPNPERS